MELNKVAILCLADTMVPPRARSDEQTIGRVTWCGATLTFGVSAWKRSETFQIASGGRHEGYAEAAVNERYVQPGSQNVVRWWGIRQGSGVALRDDCASPSIVLVLGP